MFGSEQDVLRRRRRDNTESQTPSNEGERHAEGMAKRVADAERRVRVTLEHGVNPGIAFDLSGEEAEALQGLTVRDAIRALLGRADPITADSIRRTLRDPAVLLEVGMAGGRHPAGPRERIDRYLRQAEVHLGVSQSLRGG